MKANMPKTPCINDSKIVILASQTCVDTDMFFIPFVVNMATEAVAIKKRKVTMPPHASIGIPKIG
jgi:hypothetical protein